MSDPPTETLVLTAEHIAYLELVRPGLIAAARPNPGDALPIERVRPEPRALVRITFPGRDNVGPGGKIHHCYDRRVDTDRGGCAVVVDGMPETWDVVAAIRRFGSGYEVGDVVPLGGVECVVTGRVGFAVELTPLAGGESTTWDVASLQSRRWGDLPIHRCGAGPIKIADFAPPATAAAAAVPAKIDRDALDAAVDDA